MEKRSIKNIGIIVALIAYIFIYKFVVFANFMRYSEMINASFLAIVLAVSIFLLGYRRDKSTILFQNIIKYTAFYIILAGIVIYGAGFAVGFLKNAYSREFLTLFDNIFAPIIIYGLFEFIRYVLIWANKDKKEFVIGFTVVLTLLELVFRVRSIDFGSFEALFRLSATTILPTIVKNAFFSYVCFHVGYKVPILYRMLVDVLYVYIVPIIPDLGEYIHSIVAISLPIIIYMNIYEMIDTKCNKPRPIIKKDSFSFVDLGIGTILVILISLVSGLFPLYMIGIGSTSMAPTINKGDAVILLKVDPNKKVKQGDVIAFTRNDSKKSITVVHRVTEVTNSNGKVVYVTKGDANKSEDVNMVSQSQVRGVVQFRIPLIAYPTIFFNDFVSNWR